MAKGHPPKIMVIACPGFSHVLFALAPAAEAIC